MSTRPLVPFYPLWARMTVLWRSLVGGHPPPPPLGFASGGLGEVAMFSIGGQMRLTGVFLNGFWKVVFLKGEQKEYVWHVMC